MLGYTTKEMIGKSAGIFLYDDTITAQVNRMAARTEGISQDYELALKKKNGEKLWTLVSATPTLDDQGNFKGSFGMFTDITERKQNEEVIKQLNDNLKLLNKILRHDISNDLTVVSISLEMIETDEQDLQDRAFNAIKRSVDLIEKVRTLESTMASKYGLKPVSIRKLTDSIKISYPNIIIDVKDECTVMADEALTSVIDNIINNAITHGKTDKIDMKVTSEENICQIKIIDYGKGIPDEIKGQIFDEEFSYGETRGTGLGLYIAKKTIERYGGEIEVKDTKPHGATFVIKLKKCIA
jgi:PAS domain S-box-containing protein